MLTFITNSATVTVTGYCTLSQSGYQTIGVFINGTESTPITIPTTNTSTPITISLPSGTNTLTLEPGFQLGTPGATVQGTFITKVDFATGSNNTLVAKNNNPTLDIDIHDSIGEGYMASNIWTTSWFQLVRNNTNYAAIKKLAAYGWSGNSVTDILHNRLTETVTNVVNAFIGVTTKTLKIRIGTNDYGSSYCNPTSLVTYYTTFLNTLHSGDSTIVIKLYLCILRPGVPGPVSGFLLSDFNAAIISVANSLSSFVGYVDSRYWVSSGNFADGTHPNDAGYLEYANNDLAEQNLTSGIVSNLVLIQPSSMTVGDADQALITQSNNLVAPTFTTSDPTIATIVSGKLHAVATGTVNVTANQVSYRGWGAATPSVQPVTISSGALPTPVITFNQPAVLDVGASDVALGATSTYGTPAITYASGNTAIATIVGSNLHGVAQGYTTVTASQVANPGVTNAATPVTQPISIASATGLLLLTSINYNAGQAQLVGLNWTPVNLTGSATEGQIVFQQSINASQSFRYVYDCISGHWNGYLMLSLNNSQQVHSTALMCLYLDPTSNQILYSPSNTNIGTWAVGDKVGYFRDNITGAIFITKSSDGGATWISVYTTAVTNTSAIYLCASTSSYSSGAYSGGGLIPNPEYITY